MQCSHVTRHARRLLHYTHYTSSQFSSQVSCGNMGENWREASIKHTCGKGLIQPSSSSPSSLEKRLCGRVSVRGVSSSIGWPLPLCRSLQPSCCTCPCRASQSRLLSEPESGDSGSRATHRTGTQRPTALTFKKLTLHCVYPLFRGILTKRPWPGLERLSHMMTRTESLNQSSTASAPCHGSRCSPG